MLHEYNYFFFFKQFVRDLHHLFTPCVLAYTINTSLIYISNVLIMVGTHLNSESNLTLKIFAKSFAVTFEISRTFLISDIFPTEMNIRNYVYLF